PKRGLFVRESLTAPVIVAPFMGAKRVPTNSKHKDNTKVRWCMLYGTPI
ncbi:uncharacterized protein METZ01_LOCUS405674, partial [marine metagenome]